MLSNVAQVTFFEKKFSYLKYLEFSINGIWILLLILCECEWNMVWRSYVITQVYISFWSDLMTSFSMKNWYDLRYNTASINLELLQAFLWGNRAHVYGFLRTCNLQIWWLSWNRNSYESFWRSWTCKHYWFSLGTELYV